MSTGPDLFNMAAASRRDFVTGVGLGVAALGIVRAGPLQAAVASAPVPRLPPSLILHDEYSAAGSEFGRRAAHSGVAVAGVCDDPAKLWFGQVRPRLQRGDAVLAGLTNPEFLFCLQQFAREQWLSLQLKVEHRPIRSGLIEHRLTGTSELVSSAVQLQHAKGPWAGAMADIAMALPIDGDGRATTQFMTAASPDLPEGRPLVTWVLARKA